MPAVGFLERFGGVVIALDHVAPHRSDLLEEPLRDDFLYVLIHRLEHVPELARVDEAESALTCTNGEVEAERMNVEDKSAGP